MNIASIPRRPDLPRRPDVVARPDSIRAPWSRRRIVGLLVLAAFVMFASSIGIVAVAPGLRAPSEASRGPEHAFLRATNSGPYRWDPCHAIHYQANGSQAPAGALQDLHAVVERLAEDTGIEFVFDGITDRTDRQQQRTDYLSPYSAVAIPLPVLVTWVPPEAFRRYANPRRFAGVGMPVQVSGAFDEYRSGLIVMNTGGLRPGFATRFSHGVIMQHEWGHVLGMGHVASPEELMWSPDVEGASASPDPWLTDWGPGDLEGLRALGRQAGCLS